MDYTSRYALTSINDIKKVVSGVLGGLEKHMTLTEESRYNIALVINELLANSFEHARPTQNEPVIFKASLRGGCLSISVSDQGAGFPYDQLFASLPAGEDMLLQERGRGLLLVRALCREMCYNDAGNCVEVKMGL